MDFEFTEEQRMLKTQVARFIDSQVIPLAPVIDEEERFPEENFRALADMGLLGNAPASAISTPVSPIRWRIWRLIYEILGSRRKASEWLGGR